MPIKRTLLTVLAAVALTAAAVPALADAPPAVGLVRSLDEIPTVDLTHVWVTIDLYPDRAEIHNRFTLRNRGPATGATVAVPDLGGEAPRFVTGGEDRPLTRAEVEIEGDGATLWWMTDLDFVSEQEHTCDVWRTVGLADAGELVFDLARGTSWLGVVKNLEVKVRLVDLDQDAISAQPFYMGAKNGTLMWEWTECEPGQRDIWPGAIRLSWETPAPPEK